MRIKKRSREFVEYLKNRLGPEDRALVALHDNPDPDCIASGLCLKTIFERVYHVPTVLAYDGLLGRTENRKMVEVCGIDLEKVEDIDKDSFSFVATVDSQPSAGNTFVDDSFKVDMILDHHPRLSRKRNVPWVDIRLKYGACVTIALEYLLAHDIEPDNGLSTALFYALKSETQDLGREASSADRQAYFYLLTRANFKSVYSIVNADLSREYFRSVFSGLDHARIHKDTLVTFIDKVETPDYVAESADRLLRLEDIAWTLVMGLHDDNMHLSIRTARRDADAGEIMHRLLKGMGTGGGHEMIAGGQISGVDGERYMELYEKLSKRFLNLLHKRAPGSDLLEED